MATKCLAKSSTNSSRANFCYYRALYRRSRYFDAGIHPFTKSTTCSMESLAFEVNTLFFMNFFLNFTNYSYAWTLKNDVQKVEDMQQRTNIMPLGSGALAGNPFKINREDLAHNLGFSDVTYNSMQAVADRDFVGTLKILLKDKD